MTEATRCRNAFWHMLSAANILTFNHLGAKKYGKEATAIILLDFADFIVVIKM